VFVIRVLCCVCVAFGFSLVKESNKKKFFRLNMFIAYVGKNSA
jgi:hypothetical protein